MSGDDLGFADKQGFAFVNGTVVLPDRLIKYAVVATERGRIAFIELDEQFSITWLGSERLDSR